MSAGRFAFTFYEATYDPAAIHPIRVQPETLELNDGAGTPTSNEAPEGPATNPISAVVSLAGRAGGLRPRRWNLQLTDTTPPTGYDDRAKVSLPILTQAFYDSVSVNAEVDYLGATWRLVSKDQERAQ